MSLNYQNKARAINRTFNHRQYGFSLVELMIAGVLGLLLIGGVIQLFLGSNQNFTMQDEMADIQEKGRMALLFLEDDIQRGGYVADDNGTPPVAIDFNQSTDGSNDSFAVQYNMAAGSTDCNGVAIATGEIINRYYVQDEQLMCQGNGGGTAQPLIDGVEMFQVLYGTDNNTCPDLVIKSYVNATDIKASSLMQSVFSVRIGLLLKSEDDVKPESSTETFQVLNVSKTTANDKLAHRLFQQTIYMANMTFTRINDPNRPVCYI